MHCAKNLRLQLSKNISIFEKTCVFGKQRQEKKRKTFNLKYANESAGKCVGKPSNMGYCQMFHYHLLNSVHQFDVHSISNTFTFSHRFQGQCNSSFFLFISFIKLMIEMHSYELHTHSGWIIPNYGLCVCMCFDRCISLCCCNVHCSKLDLFYKTLFLSLIHTKAVASCIHSIFRTLNSIPYVFAIADAHTYSYIYKPQRSKKKTNQMRESESAPIPIVVSMLNVAMALSTAQNKNEWSMVEFTYICV